MKKMISMALILNLLTAGVFGQCTATSGAKSAKQLSSIQAVKNGLVNHPDLMVITGRIIDAETKQPITDARINFDKFGDELVSAAIDKEGNYALALNKKEIGEQVRIIFKVDGYQRYIAKSVRSDKPLVSLDLRLRPDGSKQGNNMADMKYSLSDDMSNTMVVKF